MGRLISSKGHGDNLITASETEAKVDLGGWLGEGKICINFNYSLIAGVQRSFLGRKCWSNLLNTFRRELRQNYVIGQQKMRLLKIIIYLFYFLPFLDRTMLRNPSDLWAKQVFFFYSGLSRKGVIMSDLKLPETRMDSIIRRFVREIIEFFL